MDVWNGICQAAAAATGGILGAFCTVSDKLTKLAAPQDPITLRNLFLQVVSLENDVQKLEGQVVDLSFEERRQEALDLARSVDEQRAQFEAALQTAADHPQDIAPQTQALGAAKALAKQTFYALPGHTAGSQDRFDPRAALPSFVMAVDSWLAIRAVAQAPWTDTARQDVAAFAARLSEITSQMRASLGCQEVWQDFERISCPKTPRPKILRLQPPEPPEPPVCTSAPACSHRLSCTDKMQDETNATGQRTEGICMSHTTTNAQQNLARRLADYQVERFEAIARGWLATPK
jgi:hypothetical protein